MSFEKLFYTEYKPLLLEEEMAEHSLNTERKFLGEDFLDVCYQSRIMAKTLLSRIFAEDMDALDIESESYNVFKWLKPDEAKMFNKIFFEEMYKVVAIYVQPLFLNSREQMDRYGT